MKKTLSRVATAALVGLPLVALSQADPADPMAPAPALDFQSAFPDYKPWQDIAPADWRAVNDTVRDAAAKGGGHGGHGAAPSPAPSSAPTAAPLPATPAAAPEPLADHHGHGGHQ